jgi:hypothetical protein
MCHAALGHRGVEPACATRHLVVAEARVRLRVRTVQSSE